MKTAMPEINKLFSLNALKLLIIFFQSFDNERVFLFDFFGNKL